MKKLLLVLFTLALTSLACSLPFAQGSTTPQAATVAPPSTSGAKDKPTLSPTTGAILPTVTFTPLGPAAIAPTVTRPAATATLPAAKLSITYIDSSRNLWIWREGEVSRQLSKSGDVSEAHISADGKQVAYLRTSEYTRYSLWTVQVDGSGEKQLISTEDFNALPKNTQSIPTDVQVIGVAPVNLVWTGNYLSFSTRPIFEGPGDLLNNDLYLVNSQNGEKKTLFAPGAGGIATFSPNGQWLTLSTDRQIRLLRLAEPAKVVSKFDFEPVSTYSEWMFRPISIWNAGSTQVAFALPPGDSLATPTPPTQIVLLSTDGTAAKKGANFITQPLAFPDLSPDLKWVAYLKPKSADNNAPVELHIASIDGSSDVVYATGPVNFHSWSPDSASFLYTEQKSTGTQAGQGYQAYWIGKTGQTPVPLPGQNTNQAVPSIQWLDATRFLYLAETSGNWDLSIGSTNKPAVKISAFPRSQKSLLPSFDSVLP